MIIKNKKGEAETKDYLIIMLLIAILILVIGIGYADDRNTTMIVEGYDTMNTYVYDNNIRLKNMNDNLLTIYDNMQIINDNVGNVLDSTKIVNENVGQVLEVCQE